MQITDGWESWLEFGCAICLFGCTCTLALACEINMGHLQIAYCTVLHQKYSLESTCCVIPGFPVLINTYTLSLHIECQAMSVVAI